MWAMGWQQTYSWSVGIVMGIDLFLGRRQGYGNKPIAGMWVMGCRWTLFLECGQRDGNGPIPGMWAIGKQWTYS